MISFWKNLTFVVQIIIVVGGIIVFAYFDPLGFLSPTKRKLENTSISVRSIKDIGQLITAEYHGEVLASYKEVLQINDDEINNQIKVLHDDFKNAITEFGSSVDKSEIKLHPKRVIDKFEKEYPNLIGNIYYDSYIDWLKKKKSISLRNKFFKKCFTDENYINIVVDEQALAKIKNFEFESANKKELKQQIVIIGRGKVQAGYDFGKFTEKNFKYDKSTRTIHLIGFNAKILDYHINPWYIPEKHIPGYEIIMATGKAKKNPRYMNEVKEECVQKLRKKAIESQILEKAKENAEENLKLFFSLIVGGEGIDKVVIYQDPVSYLIDDLLADTIIKNDELLIVDSLLEKSYRAYILDSKNTSFQQLVDSLKGRKVKIYDSISEFNYFSIDVYKIVEDYTLDTNEIYELKRINTLINCNKKVSKYDSLWFMRDEMQLIVEEETKDEIEKHLDTTASIFNKRKKRKELNLDKTVEFKINKMIQDSIESYLKSDYDAIVLQTIRNTVRLYPVNGTNEVKYKNLNKNIKTSFKEYYLKNNWPDILKSLNYDSKTFIDTTTKYYNSPQPG
jgi:hypothetical protein